MNDTTTAEKAGKLNVAHLEHFCGHNVTYYLTTFQHLSRHDSRYARFNVWACLAGPYWAVARGLWLLFWLGYCIDVLALGSLFAAGQSPLWMALSLLLFILGRLVTGWMGNVAYWHAFCGWKITDTSTYRYDTSRLGIVLILMLPSALLAIAGVAQMPLHKVLTDFPTSRALSGNTQEIINQGISLASKHWGSAFDATTQIVRWVLDLIENTLIRTPWPAIVAPILLLAFRGGGIRLLLLAAVILAYLGIFGYWTKSLSTMSLVAASVLICVVFGVPLGILCAKHKGIQRIAEPVMDIMQTMPSFVYLLPAIAFFSIGKPPAILATVVFAMPPVIKLTALGIRQIPLNVKEAMLAFGASPLQLLVKAELPMAFASIMTGINQSIMMSLSMVVIAALIGAEGLGYDVLAALQQMNNGAGILAGVAIVLCAMLLDRLLRGNRRAA